MPTRTSGPERSLKGAIAWMMGALVSFSLVAISGREATRSLSVAEAMFWRNLVALVVLVAVVRLATGSLASFATRQPGRHLTRNVIHFGAQYAWLTAITLIPLAELFALEFTAPLWVALLAPLMLAERLTAARILAALIGFTGALIVARPATASLNLGTLSALASAFGFAISVIMVKQLLRTDAPVATLFYMSLIQIVPSFLMSWPAPHVPTGAALPWVATLALAGLTAHYSLARAFALADAIVVAPLDFLRLPLIAVVGALAYAEPFDPVVLAGGAVIILANAVNLWGERSRRPTG